MADDDIPGTPGVRSIGGEPLADVADDGGGGSSGGGGSTSSSNDYNGTEQFTREEVVESIERGVDVDEVSDPNEYAEGYEPPERSAGRGSGGDEARAVESDIRFDAGGSGTVRVGDEPAIGPSPFRVGDEPAIGPPPFLDQGGAGEPAGSSPVGDSPFLDGEAREADTGGGGAGTGGEDVVVAGPPPAVTGDQQRTAVADVLTDGLQAPRQQQQPVQATESPAIREASFRSDPAIRDSLTSGGVLPDEDSNGLLPSEQQLRDASEQFQSGLNTVGEIAGETGEVLGAPVRAGADVARGDFAGAAEDLREPAGGSLRAGFEATAEAGRDGAGVGEALGAGLEATTAAAEAEDDSVGERFVEGATRGIGQAGDLPGLGLTAEAGIEAGEGVLAEAPDQPAETAGTVGALASAVGGAAAEQAAESATESPAETGGAIAGGVVGGLAVGGAAGAGARGIARRAQGATDRIRTAGSTDITDEVVSPGVQRGADPDLPGGEAFPGTDRPDLVRGGDPAEAIRQSGDVPAEIADRFDDAGVEGTELFKTLDAEPRGPGRGRAGQGIRAPAAESDLADAFETTGTSFGPEPSPNFLRLDDGPSEAGLSLRPGLPSLGRNRPTTIVTRTDVENPDATTTAEFDAELRDSAGDTTAQAVRDEFQGFDPVEEAEAQVPPEAEFADLGGSTGRNIARRLGIGSDYRLEVGGRRVPVRPAAPADELDSGAGRGLGGLFGDTRGQAGAPDVDLRPASRQLDEFGDVRQPVDRPVPAVPSDGPSAGGDLFGSGSGGGSGGGEAIFGTATPGVDPERSGSQSGAGSGGPVSVGGGPSGGGSGGGRGGSGGSGGGSGPAGGPGPVSEPIPGGSVFGGTGVGGSGPAGQGAEPAPAPAPVSEPLPGTPAESRPRRDDGPDSDQRDPEPVALEPRGRATPEFRNPIAQLFPGVDL